MNFFKNIKLARRANEILKVRDLKSDAAAFNYILSIERVLDHLCNNQRLDIKLVIERVLFLYCLSSNHIEDNITSYRTYFKFLVAWLDYYKAVASVEFNISPAEIDSLYLFRYKEFDAYKIFNQQLSQQQFDRLSEHLNIYWNNLPLSKLSLDQIEEKKLQLSLEYFKYNNELFQTKLMITNVFKPVENALLQILIDSKKR